MPRRVNRRVAAFTLPLAALAAFVTTPHAAQAIATPFAVGIPTIVDPVRGVGEPDIVLDNSGNAIINGPGGTGTQTSFFWHSRDGGLSYPMMGPSSGHWICAASGGGDSLGVIDRKTNDLYLTDQEALANIGSAKIAGSGGALTSNCATAPGASADRPFEGVLNSTIAPQNVADSGKPILYLSWLCSACTGVGTGGPTAGGLAFGWSDDGIHFHAADPGVVGDFTPSNTLQEAGAINSFSFHGNTVTDPATGYVYTPITCSGSCPNSATDNQVGVVIGTPQTAAAIAVSGNLGQFSTLTYQPAVTNMVQPNSLFPVMGIDANGTLYEAYIEGDGFAPSGNPLPADAWHLYYTYSLGSDGPLHTHWSAPVRVDSGPLTATSDFGWMSVGDPGKLGFVWLGTDVREHPSLKDTSNIKQWHPFMAITTNATSTTPTFQQTQVGIGPNHINDMCLQGTVGCITGVGNRNMADFISTDIDPVTGALQATWANDSNQLATQASTMIPGLPLTETARQTSGPKLIGSGTVNDTRFSTTPTTGIADATGDATYNSTTVAPFGPLQGGPNIPQLDLTHSGVSGDGTNLIIDAQAADLTSLASPDTVNQSHVWWLTTWQFNHKIYFARAESDSGGALKCFAGAPTSFDRPGLNAQTIATLVDYSGGTSVPCSKTLNDIAITVAPSLVGFPGGGSVLESVTGFTALDNGAPLAVGPGSGNMPTIVDATPAYNALVTSLAASAPEVPVVPLLIVIGVAAAVFLLRRRRAPVT